jgi:hypothetical protein
MTTLSSFDGGSFGDPAGRIAQRVAAVPVAALATGSLDGLYGPLYRIR